VALDGSTAHSWLMSEDIVATVTWTEETGGVHTEMFTMTHAQLAERDPDGSSLLSAKLRFAGSSAIALSPVGPAEDEYMSLSLIKYVWTYMETGILEVTPDLQADDSARALEYFGFTDVAVVVPTSDPYFVGKKLVYKDYCDAMKQAPEIVKWIKTTLLDSDKIGSAGVHFVVDDRRGVTTNQFGEACDPLISTYQKAGNGVVLMRLGGVLGITCPKAFQLLGSDTKNAVSLRSKVYVEVKALGGLHAEWKQEFMKLQDIGEYGHREYRSDYRWVLIITPDHGRIDEQQGIKRRKVMA